MLPVRIRRSARPLLVASALALVVTGCSVGSVGSSGGDASGSGEATTISVLYWGRHHERRPVQGFRRLVSRRRTPTSRSPSRPSPAGTEGDNLIKTKLSTGEMYDVFHYNSGSLFQALNPDTNLAPLTDEPWVSQLSDGDEERGRARDNGTYGAPMGTTFAGGVLYNKKVYDEARPEGADHVGRVRCQQREDQGRRQGRPDRADVRRHLDVPAVRARRLRQRRGAGPGLGGGVHGQQGASTSTSRPSQASRTSRRPSTTASTTRTSPRRRTTTA